MNPKERANNLVKKYWLKNITGQDVFKIAIKHALIYVDYIIINECDSDGVPYKENNLGYWKEVKEEIKRFKQKIKEYERTTN